MKKVTICGKDYEIKPLDFNDICDLEGYGLSITREPKGDMSTIRSIFAYIAKISIEEAGNILGEHFQNGGSFDELVPIANMLADFFTKKGTK